MAASDHINPRLFHGTGHYFAEGEMVEPRTQTMVPEGRHAFASSNLADARRYASMAAAEQGTLFAPVYEVEGEDAERHPHGLTTYISKKGLKPKGIVAWGENPDVY